MSNRTFPCVNTIQLGPSPFNSSPQCKNKLFMSSFKAKFLIIRFTKVTCTCSFLCTCIFLGPRGLLSVPMMPVRPYVCTSQKFQPMEIQYKSLHHHVRHIKSYIFWKLMTPTIHWRCETTKRTTNTHTNTQIRRAWKTHQVLYFLKPDIPLKEVCLWHQLG